MCFHNMERKELQALCKKHKIPANLSNLEMANRLNEYFKEKEKPPIQEQMYRQDDKITKGTECTNTLTDFHSMKRKELQALCQKHKIPANLPNLEMAKRLTEFFKEKEKSPIQGPINVLDKIASETMNMVMNFHSMKRKDLQALCHKHNIPANLSNLEMAKRLSEFFKENEKPSIQGIVNEQDENASETESKDLAVTRKVKKVKFSPEHELFEFTRSPELKRSRRNSVSVTPSNLSVETVDHGLTSSENVDGQGTVMWFRESKLTDGHVNEKKIGKKGVKFDEQKNNVSTIENNDNGGVTGRVLRSKEKKLADNDVKNATKRGKMNIEDENALDDVDDKKPIEEIVTKTKRARRAVEIADKAPLVSGEADDNGVIARRSFRNKGVLQKSEVAEVHRGIEPHIMKRVPEKNEATEVHRVIEPQIMKRIPKKNEAVEVHGATEPHVMVRRSKRNANTVDDSQVLIDDTRKHENDMVKGSRKSAKLLAEDDAKGEMDGGVIQTEEPVKLEVRRSDRRKNVIALPEKGRNGELKAETENMRSSVPQLVIADGVSKIEKKVPQLIMRRSRRKTTILESVASVEKLDTDVAIEYCETEKYLSPRRSRRVAPVCKSLENKDELGGDTIINQKNEPKKRKRGPILEGIVVKTNDVWSSLKQSMEEIRNEKSVSIVEPQLSKSERAESSGGTDTRNKNMTSDVGIGESNRNIFRGEQDVSITEIAESDFVGRNEIFNSVENATSRITELEADFAVSEKQTSASNIKDARKVDLLELDVQDIAEQDITNMDKNQSEAQLFSPIEDCSHVDTMDNQIIEEGSNVSGNEVFAESRSAADSVLPADLVDHVCEAGGVSVQENPVSIEIGEANVITSAIACCHNVVDHIEVSDGISVDNNDDNGEVGAPETCVDPEVTEAEAEIGKQRSSDVADHAGYVEANSVQNADHLEASNNNFDDEKEDGASEAGEVGTPESRERFIEYTDSKSALQLKETSGKMGSIKDASAEIEIGGCLKELKIANDEAGEFGVADLIENVDHLEASNSNIDDKKTHGASEAGEVGTPESCESALQLKETSSGKMRGIEGDNAEIEKGGCLKEHKAVSDEDDEFGVADLFAGERSVGISSQDREIISGKYSAMKSDEQLMDKEYLAISPKTTSPNVTNICPERDLEDEHTGTGDESRMDNKEYLAISPNTTSPNVTYICPERDLEAGEVGTPESCESALHLKGTLSGKMRGINGDNAETETGGCLMEHKVVSDEDDEFGVTDLFAGERSVGISSQDREIVSGEYSAMKYDKQVMDKVCLAISPITTSPNVNNTCPERDFQAEDTGTGDESRMDKEYLAISPKTTTPNVTYISPERDFEAEHTGTGDESCIDKIIHPEVAKTDEDGSPDCHENRELVMSNILDVERRDEIAQQDGEILSGENSVEGFDEEGMELKLKSVCETYHISEGGEAENNDNHENRKTVDGEFSVSNLIECEKTNSVTQQDSEIFSAQELNKVFYEQSVSDDFPFESTMCGEVEIAAVSSSLKEITQSKPRSSSKSPGTGLIISDACEIIVNESGSATFPEKEVAIVQNSMGGDHEIFSQADEHINHTPMQAEQPKSPLAITTAITNTLCASERETTGLAMCTSQTHGKEITSPVVEGSNANEDGDGNCGKDKDKLADACITAVDMSLDCTVSKSEDESLCELGFHQSEDTTHHQFPNLHENNTWTDVNEKPNDVEPSKSLTEIEFSNLIEATVNDVTPTGANDTMNRSYVNSGNSVINKKAKEMEGETENETAKTTCENAFWPTNKDVSDSVPGVDREDYQLRLLFATPIKIDPPTKIGRTSSHKNQFNKADELVIECVGIAVEDSAAQIKNDEKLRDAENELENSLCSSSSTGEKINYEESNEVESVESMNTSGLGFSEASEKHLTDNSCDEEGQDKSGFISGENEDEYGWAEENSISLSGSLRNKEIIQGCQDILMDTDLSENLSCGNRVCPKSERKMALSSGAEFEIVADIQKYNVLENSLKSEGADIGSFNGKKDVTGTSPSFLPNDDDNGVAERKNETGDDINPNEAKNWDEKDDDSRPLPDIPDEPHCNSEVAILKSPSVGETHEHQSTYKDTSPITQNLDNVLPAAEQGFSVCGSEFDEFSNLAMHILPGDAENGDSKKSETGTPVYNSGGEEKKCKGFEKKTTATEVQFSISEFHLEQNVLDLNNDVHSASAEVTANKNCDVEKSEVGTPLLNLKGDHENYDEGVEENSTATVVQFPILELHIEENILDSNNGVPAAAFGCKEFLKESEVDDTIKEYIDSELAFMNEVAMCEDGMESEKLEETISSVNLQVGDYTADKSSVETESEEKIDEMLLKESVTRNLGSAGNDAFLLQKEDNESEDGHISSSPPRQLCSDMKESARTILIHGTPSKVATMVDMKENGPAYKSSNIGDFTAARPAKRKALQDVKWK